LELVRGIGFWWGKWVGHVLLPPFKYNRGHEVFCLFKAKYLHLLYV
jgi:hypothetical protein